MSAIDLGIHLADAQRSFERLVAGDHLLKNAELGLDAILRSAHYPTSIADEYPRQAAELVDILFVATLALCEATGRHIARELVELAMAAASALVSNPGSDALRQDHYLYVALLRFEISAAMCRREIAARGDLLVRSIAVRKADAADGHKHTLQ